MAADDIRSQYERCTRRYPTIDLSFEDFLARARLSGTDPGLLCHEDLFLATACARGDRIAWEYFADEYLPLLQRMAARACRQHQESEDLAQDIVANLIADKSRLAGYNGRGSLAGWLRVTLSHALIDRLRRQRREVALDESEEQQSRAASSETACGESSLDASWGSVFSEVLQEQIRLLPPADRLILALYYVHGISLKAIGKHLGVHEATASRRLDGARQTIRKRVERELRTRHRLQAGEIRGLWEWVAEHDLFSLADALNSRCEVQAVSGRSAVSSRPEGKDQ